MAVIDGLGINANYSGAGSNLAQDIPMLAALGFKTIRLLIVGYYSQPTIDLWNGFLNNARNENFNRIIIGIGPGAATLTASNWSDFSAAVMAQATYITALNDLRIELQIGNENELHHDNSLTDAQVRNLLRADASAVKAAYPNIKTSYASSVFVGDEVLRWKQEGIGDFNRVGFNVYGNHRSFVNRLEEIASMGAAGYITEWGTSNGYNDFNDESLFKQEIQSRLFLLKQSGIKDFIYYGFQEHENKWGAKTTTGVFRHVWPVLIGSRGVSVLL